MSLRLTILGCGSSGGVPRIGNNWGQCDPNELKNRRRRCSVLLEKREGDALTRVLVDTTPDLVSQLNSVDAGTLDGVWYTHEHADHTHGIDDLRQVAINMRERVNVWADHSTAEMLLSRFSYCFLTPPGSSYPPILEMNTITAGQVVSTVGAAGAISAMPFSVNHGDIDALGFRWGNVAYTPDVKNIPADVTHHLEGLDVWIIDALRRTPHPSHFNLDDALGWIERMAPRRAILTNMHIDMDFQSLCNELPEGVEPAYDGMVIDITGDAG
jgi:phosphoribosyl 1,2-cyclic phosphate phosphodiesterase